MSVYTGVEAFASTPGSPPGRSCPFQTLDTCRPRPVRRDLLRVSGRRQGVPAGGTVPFPGNRCAAAVSLSHSLNEDRIPPPSKTVSSPVRTLWEHPFDQQRKKSHEDALCRHRCGFARLQSVRHRPNRGRMWPNPGRSAALESGAHHRFAVGGSRDCRDRPGGDSSFVHRPRCRKREGYPPPIFRKPG